MKLIDCKMHERSIAAEIINEAQKLGKVKGITVEVGDLGHLPADEMKEVLQEMTDGWNIDIVKKKSEVKCSCGYQGEPEIVEQTHGHVFYKCPKCGESSPEIITGHDIILKDVDVE